MEIIFPPHMIWWITVIDIPLVSGLFIMILKTRRDFADTKTHMQHVIDTRHAQMRDSLAAYKLEVAKYYASISDVKDLEEKLVRHLLRIEDKLDQQKERGI